jgi:hypothetical protein
VGDHTVAVRIRSKEKFSEKVAVKPAAQGITPLDVRLLLPDDLPGTLQIKFACSDPNWWSDLELLIDGMVKPVLGSWFNEYITKLPQGKHTVALKKNGIQVYSGDVQVKDPTSGTTFLTVPLVVNGTIRLVNKDPIAPGVVAGVKMDGQYVKEWPVGATSVELSAAVGKRVVTVYTTRPLEKTWFQGSVDVEAGKTAEVKLP